DDPENDHDDNSDEKNIPVLTSPLHRQNTFPVRLVCPTPVHSTTVRKVQTEALPAPSSTVDVIMCSVGWIMVAGRRLAMNSAHGWFSDNKEWIEFIALTVVFWLLTMISVFDLRSAG